MTNPGFRIVLAGGGPVGLVAAHVFAAADIDFVLLEQRPFIVPQQGAGIVLFPHTQRVFEQLGLMDRICKIAHPFLENRSVSSGGRHYDTNYTSNWTKEKYGFLHSPPELLQVLYDALPDKVKPSVLAGKKVDDIEVTPEGVIVRCTDGTVEKGSIVVGADEVHSRVRDCMQKLARADSGATTEEDEALVSTYRCLYGSTGHVPGLELGWEWDLHSSGIAMQLFGTEDMSWFLFYDKLASPSRERKRYSDDEVDQLASRVADVYVTDKVQFKDVWNARQWVMLADLPEGILKKWSWNRIVLVGDAASKQTPNIGQGWNCGVQDVVVLVNDLQDTLKTQQGAAPTTEALADIFQKYQDTRLPDLEVCMSAAAGATRAAAWDTWSVWLKDRFITRLLGGNKEALRQGPGGLISKSRILEFLPEGIALRGAIKWKYTSKVQIDGTRRI
ncbi:2-heptyl-3-hydroxy-4(1H)-quinolone synthase 1 [Seiridium cupressi]